MTAIFVIYLIIIASLLGMMWVPKNGFYGKTMFFFGLFHKNLPFEKKVIVQRTPLVPRFRIFH